MLAEAMSVILISSGVGIGKAEVINIAIGVLQMVFLTPNKQNMNQHKV